MPAPAPDAVLVVSFGGPEGPDDVLPFLDNVLRGRPVPPERRAVVAEHYLRFGGVSPIQAHNRALIAALEGELAAHGHALPVYWGNRNWHPYLADTIGRMRDDGVRHALAWVTSAYSSHSGCRQYLDDIAAARATVGPDAPEVTKLRPFFDHPGFIGPWIAALREARRAADPDAPLLFSAHSIPTGAARTCDYESQLRDAAALIAEGAGERSGWELVFQSRSGPPSQPWLEPDVLDALRALPAGTPSAIVAPIGFVSDHMEVVYDLDTEAAAVAAARQLRLVRVATPGTDPRFVAMIRHLVEERLEPGGPVEALGRRGPWPTPCRAGCCPAPSPRPAGAPPADRPAPGGGAADVARPDR